MHCLCRASSAREGKNLHGSVNRVPSNFKKYLRCTSFVQHSRSAEDKIIR